MTGVRVSEGCGNAVGVLREDNGSGVALAQDTRMAASNREARTRTHFVIGCFFSYQWNQDKRLSCPTRLGGNSMELL
jgi:hypothetical protein